MYTICFLLYVYLLLLLFKIKQSTKKQKKQKQTKKLEKALFDPNLLYLNKPLYTSDIYLYITCQSLVHYY